MNLLQLKYFHAVVTYRTVSLAAEHLYISQPSLSNAIRALEKEFGVCLFQRRYNGMLLTPEGTKLYNATKDLLSRFDEVERMMHRIGKDAHSLRLGIPPMISSFIFSDIYKDFVLKHPTVELTITEKGRDELLDRLNDGLLDVVLLPHAKPFDSSICAKKIGTLEIVCCVRGCHPLSAAASVSAKELASYPLVLFSDTFFQTQTIREWFARAGAVPSVSVQTEQLSTAESMIESGLAVGFMFKTLVDRNDALTSITPEPRILMDVSVLRKKDVFISEGMKSFERYIQASHPFEKG